MSVASAKSPERAQLQNRLQRHLENPFLVLELDPSAGVVEMERQGQKLLSMLAAGIAEAKTYSTPLGPSPRSAELVRMAMAELRDPERRFVHEWWARGWGQAP
jgi:hypothetical protein